MSKRRNRRRFYPEFYTEEEIEEVQETKENELENFDYTDYFDNLENIEIEIPNDMCVEEVEEIESLEKFRIIEDLEDNENPIVHKKHKELENYAQTSENPIIYKNNFTEKCFEIKTGPETEFEPKLEPEPEPKAELKVEPEIEINPEMLAFDKASAIEYANRWALDRNPNYYNFEEFGGDCTNYISQILLAGGCKMDKNSVANGWYYNTPNDKSPSWTGVEYLYDYLVKEKDCGIIAVEIEPGIIEAGDIVQLSFNGKTFQHTPFIVSVKRDSDDSVSFDRVKICAHSFDSQNRPLDTYQWKKIRFIRILGYKNG